MPYRENMAQDEVEITRLAAILAEEEVDCYLEIGSKFGGSLWAIAMSLPIGSRIVAVDLPNDTRSRKSSSESLKYCIADLKNHGYDAQVIWGDSTDATVIQAVRRLGPYDAAFIDANHTRPFVEADWAAYGPMARIVAFHDINWRRAPGWVGTRIDVPEFWETLKGKYRHEEIKLCPTGKNNGIGVLWRS